MNYPRGFSYLSSSSKNEDEKKIDNLKDSTKDKIKDLKKEKKKLDKPDLKLLKKILEDNDSTSSEEEEEEEEEKQKKKKKKTDKKKKKKLEEESSEDGDADDEDDEFQISKLVNRIEKKQKEADVQLQASNIVFSMLLGLQKEPDDKLPQHIIDGQEKRNSLTKEILLKAAKADELGKQHEKYKFIFQEMVGYSENKTNPTSNSSSERVISSQGEDQEKEQQKKKKKEDCRIKKII